MWIAFVLGHLIQVWGRPARVQARPEAPGASTVCATMLFSNRRFFEVSGVQYSPDCEIPILRLDARTVSHMATWTTDARHSATDAVQLRFSWLPIAVRRFCLPGMRRVHKPDMSLWTCSVFEYK